MTNTRDVERAIELEDRIRELLAAGGVSLDLKTAGCLLSIAIDHFAEHPVEPFIDLMVGLKGAAARALDAGALCPTCRAELERDREVDALVCRWCST